MAATIARAHCVAARPSARTTVVVRASQQSVDRRAFLGLLAGAVVLAVPKDAQAIKITSQEFTGGLVTGGGSSPKSATAASMEGYNMEGTKKQGISAKKRAKTLANARAAAEKIAVK